MTRLTFLLVCLLFMAGAPADAVPVAASTSEVAAIPDAVIADPPRDAAHPARNQQLLVPSHGEEMNALLLLAAGEGTHPTMLLLHGLPGNEQNLDLAQAIRRAGWNVLTLHYRGSWGSPGTFSMAHAIEDAGAALAFLRRPDVAREYGIDTATLVIGGHSMGGLAAALQAANDDAAGPAAPLVGLIIIDAWNAGLDGDALATGGAQMRARFEAALDDFGHSLAGATPATIADELLVHRRDWNLAAIADRLAARPVLIVNAAEGGGPRLRPLVAAIRAAPGGEAHLVAEEMPTDHGFADHRIALAAAVVRWLGEMGRPAN
jgi:acetyl esterase/lipase